MRRYILGIGSNIEPVKNIPAILNELLQISQILPISRILRTAPVDIIDASEDFLNCSVCFTSPWDAGELQHRLHKIEEQMGRDRSGDASSWRSRPADIDVLFEVAESRIAASAAAIPTEPFIRNHLDEFLTYLGLESELELSIHIHEGEAIQFNGRIIGTEPTTIEV